MVDHKVRMAKFRPTNQQLPGASINVVMIPFVFIESKVTMRFFYSQKFDNHFNDDTL